MDKNINLLINSDIYEKFCLALNLTKESPKDAMETCMRWYIANAFEKTSQHYNPNNPKILSRESKVNKDFEGKAIHRIPIWALKPTQYNHKIVKAYFMAEDIEGEVTLSMMEKLCSDKEMKDLYVPTFKNNYSQMKLDGPKSHGKVFVDDGMNVWIWDEVRDVLMQYKNNFYCKEN